MNTTPLRFLRYPGGKQRILDFLLKYLPDRDQIKGRFVEPFVGGGAVFFALSPKKALLADVNPELIDLYRGIRRHAKVVLEQYRGFPSSKKAYYEIRGLEHRDLSLAEKAARTLFLNRTCFKGMWRHNSSGQFNVGYGGQDRRWSVDGEGLIAIGSMLRRTVLRCGDFEDVIEECTADDYVFLDPPYRPGEKDMPHDHYAWSFFRYEDHERLAKCLRVATKRKVKWAITTTSHPDVLKLFSGNYTIALPRGTGGQPGLLAIKTGEVLIRNHEGLP